MKAMALRTALYRVYGAFFLPIRSVEFPHWVPWSETGLYWMGGQDQRSIPTSLGGHFV
jgi:hypothetical protein